MNILSLASILYINGDQMCRRLTIASVNSLVVALPPKSPVIVFPSAMVWAKC